MITDDLTRIFTHVKSDIYLGIYQNEGGTFIETKLNNPLFIYLKCLKFYSVFFK